MGYDGIRCAHVRRISIWVFLNTASRGAYLRI